MASRSKGFADGIDDPIVLFNSLRRPTDEISDLWTAEREVLEKYARDFARSPRLAIQLPTGSGKSVIGIIIAEAWRRKGKHVAILTSTKALMEDMKSKCDALGVDSVVISGRSSSDEDNRQRLRNIKNYKRNQAVGVFNYWSYMKGTDIADADVIVIDDADNFEGYLLDHYSVRIPRASDIWYQIVRKLTEFRVYQKLESFVYGRLPDDYQVIYFPHSIEMASYAGKAILSADPKDVPGDLLVDFQENKDRLHTYLMFVSNNDIVFTPQICPTSLHPRLRSVPRIIFMSATIGSDEMLHKRLGFQDPIDKISEGDLSSAIGTMGKRIVFPISGLSPSRTLTSSVLGAIDLIVQKFGKALILCVSFADLETIKGYLESRNISTITYKRDSDITTFRGATNGVLLTAGRFFGIDLSKKACQAVIIPRLPFVLGPIDLLAQEVLEDDRYATEKVGHRLVQGFGRCNRGLEDQAVYFALDGRLASDMLGKETIFRHFPQRLRAEADYGQEYAENGGVDACIAQGRGLVQGAIPDFDRNIEQRVASESESPAEGPGRPYVEEISGWHLLAERRNYVDAARNFEEAAKKCEGEGMILQRAWMYYLSAFAQYLAGRFYNDTSYANGANASLETSIKLGNNSWFNGLRIVQSELTKSPVDQDLVSQVEGQLFGERVIRTWQEFFTINQRKQTPYQAWEALCQAILSGSHNEACEAFGLVLELLGFEVHHLRREKGTPDLQAFSIFGTKYVLAIEVKSRERGNELGRDDVDQITGHKARYQKEYPDHRVFTLVITNRESQSDTAIEKAKHNTRIILAPVLVAFLRKYWSIVEQVPKASDPGQRLGLIGKIPQLERLVGILEPRDNPIIALGEFDAFLKGST